MKKILICYYTETQSTKDVCQAIADNLATSNQVTCQLMSEVKSLDDYDVIIIGAPVHGMKWHLNAYRFVEAHADELNSKHTVYFAMASLAYQGRGFWQKKVFKALEDASKIVTPFETAIFGGITGDMPKVLSILFGLPKKPKRDQRDWDIINQWISRLSKKIETL